MDMSALITKMVLFVVFMVIGYALARTGRAGRDFTKAASSLVLNVFMCATIINSVVVSDAEPAGGKLMHVLLVMTAALLLCYILAGVAARLIPVGKDKAPEFELMTAVPNNMFIALPVAESLLGATGVFYCSLSCIPFNILLYTYGVWRMKSGGGKNTLRLKDVVSIPLVATFAALVIFIFRIPVPHIARELLSAASGATMPMSMIVIGASLGSVSLLDAFKDWRLYVCGLLRLIAAPLLVYAVCGLITTDPVLLMTAVIMAAAPGAVVVTVFAIQYGRDEVFTSEGILHCTVLAMFTIPLMAYILG